MKDPGLNHKHIQRLAIAISMAMVSAHSGAAIIDDFGSPSVYWNNSFKYGLMYRLKEQNDALKGAGDYRANFDDGNSNFDKGIVSNRLEYLTELDIIAENGFGVRASALAWYDRVYNQRNDNPGYMGGAYPNQSGDADRFPDQTRDLQGRSVELRDAFVFGRLQLGESPLRFRLGQYSLVWGESLFFANNAIAGAQNAFDIDRLLADPTSEAKEFVLPVAQASAELQLNQNVTVGAYLQFEHVANRLPAVGSYFSSNDTGVDGAQRMLLGPATAERTKTLDADSHGQFGLKLRWRLDNTDLGFYAVRFHDKSYQQVVRLGFVPALGGVAPVSYYHTYHEGTTALGFSASRSFDSVNLAMETSVRRNQALASGGHAVDLSGLNPTLPASDNRDHPAYAVGKTAHLNLSAIWTVPRTPLWEEANFIGELAANRMLRCDESCDALDPNASRDAKAVRVVFEPTYRQIISGLDLSVPVGMGYAPAGARSSLGPGFPAEDGGDFTLGLKGTYLGVWEVRAAYTKFLGNPATFLDDTNSFTYQQSLKDRDFVAFRIRRSF